MIIEARSLPPKEAIAFWQDKVPLTAKEYAALDKEAQARGFFVAGLAKGDLLSAMKDSLGIAIAEGKSFAAWKKEIGPQLEREGWIGNNPHRLETIFRNNMQSAYMAGRYAQLQKTVALRPYLQMSGVNDDRTRPSHAALHGLVYPANDAFWDVYYPPNGHRCRCGVISLSARQVEQRGLTVQTEVDHLREHPEFGVVNTYPRGGFDRNVGKDWWSGPRRVADKDLHPEAWAEAQKHPPADALRPKPVKSYAELGRELEVCCAPYMVHGKPVQVETKIREYFMATNCQGKITLSSKTHRWPDGMAFNAAKELKDAWNALARGKPLTWNQEYAVESLWHEIMHNRQVTNARLRPRSAKDNLMEMMNQWLSRRTYQDFLGKLGGKPGHQADICKNGLGYRLYVRNFDRLLSCLGMRDGDVLPGVRSIHESRPWDTYDVYLLDLLHKKNPAVSAGKLQRLLHKIDISEKDFEELLESTLMQG